MKYIIEIEDEPFGRDDDMEHYLYRAKGFKSLVFDQEGLAKLVEFDHMRPSWYEETYQKGLDDAWDAAKRVMQSEEDGGMSMSETRRCFGMSYSRVLSNMTASECLSKLKEYEQQKERIEVGDEVVFDGDVTAVVLDVDDEMGYVHVFTENGCGESYNIKRTEKTGRHFPEISEVLKKMQEGQDG